VVLRQKTGAASLRLTNPATASLIRECSRLTRPSVRGGVSKAVLFPGSLCTVTEQEEHENGLALFVSSEWRTRFRESLHTPKRRKKLRRQLPHFSHLDPRFTTHVPTHEQSSAMLGARLRAKGAAATCHLLSEDDEFDGRRMPLDEALSEIVERGSFSATFISCIPGRLAYFHDENPKAGTSSNVRPSCPECAGMTLER
jgi:hypothetical protein